ncbi:N-acetylmuramoyl-L-alanine amidase CwlA [Alkalihalobacillus xiaoxiensis]|uniref:N-acetylmuramoyl-L-alanine amidase n=1 Tax=Shouchella xiaoxiensis TaxID=766895 RepID=A0ABS2SZL1_9BACI|nr:N-acetylmuramoyl-L-alanine amidase [Shouchella xiaoxiensis]MBM7839904.1 N-acetylmuramoyl-L-alanine amidase CwlA [Shouchella xiaoxiensis]
MTEAVGGCQEQARGGTACLISSKEGDVNDVKIVKDYIPLTNQNRPGFPLTPRYLTIHETGNRRKDATALMHARYVKRRDTAVSWHYTVDDQGTIYQHLPTTENGWHAGDGRHGRGNRESIGIELCVNEGSDFTKTKAQAVQLIRQLMQQFSIPLDRVVPHQHWSGKRCPQRLLNERGGFASFQNLIMSQKPAPQPKETAQPVSIVDWMKQAGMDASYANRANLAQMRGITGYTGTAAQNRRLLSTLIEETQQKSSSLPTVRSGEGIVDWMKRAGLDESYTNRAKLARAQGIENYRGTAEQNTELLRKLAEG